MVETVLRREIDGSFAGGDAMVPFFEHEVSAAEQVVCFGVSWGMADLLLQGLDGVVYASGSEQIFGGIGGGSRGKRECEK